jgi:hypothetical protein
MDHECESFTEKIDIGDNLYVEEKREALQTPVDLEYDFQLDQAIKEKREALQTPVDLEYDFQLDQAIKEKREALQTPAEHEHDFQLEQAFKEIGGLDLKPKPENLVRVESKIEPDIESEDREKISFFSGRQIQGLIYFLVILSAAMNGFLYSEYDKYKDQTELFTEQYFELYNSTNSIQDHFENLTSQYSELRSEYSLLDNMYDDLMKRNADLQSEYDSILSYEIEYNLVSGKTIELGPKENYTTIYNIPFSGFITVNYSATGEIYSWVGSSTLSDVYYSRNPQFPHTASNHNFTIPVLPDVVLFFANGDEFESVEITYSVYFVY